ncbi:energy transducer TonB family protein [Tenuifilum osseticum]|uniref:energy transducer TonB family protein n=1 Tax=Tenuifilum osseticum TaxID=3374723 RepID=UPI0034E4C591
MPFAQKIEDAIERFYSAITVGVNHHKIGILSTIVVHLLLIVVFLVLKIETRKEYYGSTIEMEFEEPKEEAIVQQKLEPTLPPDVLKPEYETEAIRNFAVDASKTDLNAGLSDEKNTDADELYREANQVYERMQQNRELYEQSQKDIEANIPNTPEKTVPKSKEGQYKGPTVVSYYLLGRKALHLPVPSYKCELGGQVVVNIEVKPDGRVADAVIDRANSVNDDCINQAAIQAAMASIFTSVSGTARQRGSITYLFVPQ